MTTYAYTVCYVAYPKLRRQLITIGAYKHAELHLYNDKGQKIKKYDVICRLGYIRQHFWKKIASDPFNFRDFVENIASFFLAYIAKNMQWIVIASEASKHFLKIYQL